MDGAIDLRLIITLGGILFSVAGAAAVGKMQIKVILEQLADIESRLRVIDQRVDQTEITSQRVDVLSAMMSPAEREKGTREIERVKANLDHALAEITHLKKIHNGSHIATRSLD